MKRIITCIFLAMTISAFAGDFVKDAEPAILEVHYTRTEVTDTTKRESKFYKDPVMLRIGKNMSLFCGTKKLWSDSLGAINPDLELEIYFKTMDDNKKNGTHNLMGGYYWSYIYKNYPQGKVTEQAYFDGIRHRYEEDWEKQEWEITDSAKTIIGYECFKATTEFRGRKWTAWFTPEIPIQDGPWKLCGLPGLILEAYDTNRDYSFTADGIQQNGISDVGYMTYDNERGVSTCSRDKFLKDWWRFKNSNFAGKMRAAFGHKPHPEDFGKFVVNYDKEEIDYPHDL